MKSPAVWFITGAGSGMGRHLIPLILARGDRVIATTRKRSLHLLDEVKSDNCLVLELDVTDSYDTIKAIADKAIAQWGTIDVLVNNAGFGVGGTVEELGVEGLQLEYSVNVFGAVNVSRAFLPHMRERRSGTIVFIGSRSAWRDLIPGMGMYGSSKAAIRSVASSLAAEVAQFNIRTTLIEPGGMKTPSWAKMVRPTDNLIPAYEELRTKAWRWMDGQANNQPNDAAKIAEVVVDLVRGEGLAGRPGREWPEWVILGADAEQDVREKCAKAVRLLDEWADVSATVTADK